MRSVPFAPGLRVGPVPPCASFQGFPRVSNDARAFVYVELGGNLCLLNSPAGQRPQRFRVAAHRCALLDNGHLFSRQSQPRECYRRPLLHQACEDDPPAGGDPVHRLLAFMFLVASMTTGVSSPLVCSRTLGSSLSSAIMTSAPRIPAIRPRRMHIGGHYLCPRARATSISPSPIGPKPSTRTQAPAAMHLHFGFALPVGRGCGRPGSPAL